MHPRPPTQDEGGPAWSNQVALAKDLPKRLALACTSFLVIFAVLIVITRYANDPVFGDFEHEAFLEKNKYILIMSYKRIDALTSLLDRLSSLPGVDKYHVIVTQTVDPWQPQFGHYVHDLLKNRTQLHSTYISNEMIVNDGSFSTNQQLYGSKRNSMINLGNGLAHAFDTFPDMDYLTVVEDDIATSPDILEFFDHCKLRMRSKPDELLFSTSLNHFRGYPDQRFFEVHNHIPKWYPDPRRVLEFRMQRIVFKTFAWVISRKAWSMAESDFQDMILYQATERLHPFFEGCEYCENFCYDHYLEWRFRDYYFLSPEVPRASQSSKGGMTETVAESTENVYNNEFFSRDEYVDGRPILRLQPVVNALMVIGMLWIVYRVAAGIVNHGGSMAGALTGKPPDWRTSVAV